MFSVKTKPGSPGKVREIALLGNPVLRKVAKPVSDFSSSSVQQIIADMHATLAVSNGVGIAAPQIAESLAIVIIASRPTPRYPSAPSIPPVVMINPLFDIVDDSPHKDWEGCLSIPGIRARVPRYAAIRVNYQDQQGNRQSMKLSDFPARIFQHEFDHLQGKVYLDNVENNADIITESEFQKLI